MCIFKSLKKDYKVIDDLIDQLLGPGRRSVETQKKLFTSLKNEINLHHKFQAEVFYPAVESAIQKKNFIKEFFTLHYSIDELLNETGNLLIDSPEWKSNLLSLKEYLHNQIAREEHSLFPIAKEVLTAEESEELTNQLEKLHPLG